MKHIFLTLSFLLGVNAEAKIFEERLISGDKAKEILSNKYKIDDEEIIFYESRLPLKEKIHPEDGLDYEVLNDEDSIISESRSAIKKRFAPEDGIPQGNTISAEDILSPEENLSSKDVSSSEDSISSEDSVISSENEMDSEDILPPEDPSDLARNFGLDKQSKSQILTTAAATSVILDKVTGKVLKRQNKARSTLRRANLPPTEAKIIKQGMSSKFVPKLLRAVSRLSGITTAAIAGYSIGEFIVEVDKNKFDGKLVNAVSTSAEPVFEQIYKLDKAIFGVR